MRKYFLLAGIGLAMLQGTIALAADVELGPRPYYLIDRMEPSPLKEKLES